MTTQLIRALARAYRLSAGSHHVFKLASRLIHGVAVARDDGGNRYLLDLDNYIDCHLFLKGSFDKNLLVPFLACARKHECRQLIDVGANIGVFSVRFGACSQFETIHAFEPDPRNYAQLQANLFLNHLYTKVRSYPIALSSENGRARLHLARTTRPTGFLQKINTGTSSLTLDEKWHAAGQSVEVETRRLDDLLRPENQRIAVKIDVEQHEEAVLRGMETLLEKNHCVLLVEIFPDRFPAVDAFLRGRRYVPESAFRDPDNHLYVKADGPA